MKEMPQEVADQHMDTVSAPPQPPASEAGWITRDEILERGKTRVFENMVSTILAVSLLCIWLLSQLVFLVLLFLKPLSLLGLHKRLSKLSMTVGGNSIGLHSLCLLPVYIRSDQVLNAWVKQHCQEVWGRFSQSGAFEKIRNDPYEPMPVAFQKHGEKETETIEKPRRADFAPILAKKPFCLRIQAEGGAGKTTLAYRIAKWVCSPESVDENESFMLPVLIEGNLLGHDPHCKRPLFHAVQHRLPPVEDAVLDLLLEKGKILVVMDHLSELSEEDRTCVRLASDPTLKLGAFIVTTRLETDVEERRPQTIHPLHIDSKHIIAFLAAYVKEAHYELDEFGDALEKLSKIVGDRAITALVARLFAQEMIQAKERTTASKNISETMPDLILKSLQGVAQAKEAPDVYDVQRVAKKVAWLCLKSSFRPSECRQDTVREELGDETNLSKILAYLHSFGFLLKNNDLQNSLRISQDPVAEYLAALRVLDLSQEAEDRNAFWNNFFDEARRKEGGLESIRGFLLALLDCVEARSRDADVPAFVHEELTRMAGLDPEEVRKAKTKRRVKELCKRLKSDHENDRVFAVEQLRECGQEAKEAMPVLIEAMKNDPEGKVRSIIAKVVGCIDPESNEVISSLLYAMIEDKDYFVRRDAVLGLGSTKATAQEAIPALTAALKDMKSEWVRKAAADTLGKYCPDSTKAIQALIVALKGDASEDVRLEIVPILGRLRSKPKEVLSTLIAVLRNDNSGSVRSKVINTLLRDFLDIKIGSYEYILVADSEAIRRTGPEFKEVIQALIAVLKNDPEDRVRCAAVEALKEIGPEAKEAVPTLIAVLTSDQDIDTRSEAAQALGSFGPEAKEAVPALIAVMKDDEIYDDVRSAAAEALGEIGPEAREAVPGLIIALQDRWLDVRSAAAGSLGQIGQEAKEAVPALLAALKDDQGEWVRRSAARALGEFNSEAKEVVPALLAALKDDQGEWVCRSAARALGKFNSEAKEAMPLLQEIMNDDKESEFVREAAREALLKIEGNS